MILVMIVYEEMEAPARMNLAQLANSIEPSSFKCGQNWHEFLQIHVQFASKTLHNHEFIKRNGPCVKKLEVLGERKI
jgi:hypothetical protein